MSQNSPAVFITGAAKRVGRAIALDLAQMGYDVAIHFNGSEEDAFEVVEDIRRLGRRSAAFQADLAQPSDAKQLFAQISETFGLVDILINNASVFVDDRIDDLSDDVWDMHFNLHVKTPSILASDFAAQNDGTMRGLIVNIIDQRVWNLNPRFYSYTLSKSALWTATQTLAQALAPRVRVNGIGPGPTLPSYRQTDQDLARQVTSLPLQKGPDLSEFANTMDYLWRTPSVTGQMLALDGGQHLTWETPDVSGVNE
ncbi:MAG: SDR family oxidoreductase [Pseudomonadota bacterium]